MGDIGASSYRLPRIDDVVAAAASSSTPSTSTGTKNNPLAVASLTSPSSTSPKAAATTSPKGQIASPPTSNHSFTPSTSQPFTCPSLDETLQSHGALLPSEMPLFRFMIRQQPEHGLAVGNDESAYKNARAIPLDPPPICELIPEHSSDLRYISVPELSVHARLVHCDEPYEEVACTSQIKDPLISGLQESGFIAPTTTRHEECLFVFAELGVRTAGEYRIRFDLIDRLGFQFRRLTSIYTQPFTVVPDRKTFTGLQPSTALVHALVRRGLKMRIIKLQSGKREAKKRKKSNEETEPTSILLPSGLPSSSSSSISSRRSFALPSTQYSQQPPSSLVAPPLRSSNRSPPWASQPSPQSRGQRTHSLSQYPSSYHSDPSPRTFGTSTFREDSSDDSVQAKTKPRSSTTTTWRQPLRNRFSPPTLPDFHHHRRQGTETTSSLRLPTPPLSSSSGSKTSTDTTPMVTTPADHHHHHHHHHQDQPTYRRIGPPISSLPALTPRLIPDMRERKSYEERGGYVSGSERSRDGWLPSLGSLYQHPVHPAYSPNSSDGRASRYHHDSDRPVLPPLLSLSNNKSSPHHGSLLPTPRADQPYRTLPHLTLNDRY